MLKKINLIIILILGIHCMEVPDRFFEFNYKSLINDNNIFMNYMIEKFLFLR